MPVCVVFDLETSGIKYEHEIIQIGAVAVDLADWTYVDEFDICTKFDIDKADAEALRMNSFSQAPERWKSSVTLRQGLQAFFEWVEAFKEMRKVSKRGKPYYVAQAAAYNISFDRGFLNRAAKNEGLFCPLDTYNGLDVLQLARWKFAMNRKEVPENYKLGTMVEKLGIPVDKGATHDALYDAHLTVEVMKKLL